MNEVLGSYAIAKCCHKLLNPFVYCKNKFLLYCGNEMIACAINYFYTVPIYKPYNYELNDTANLRSLISWN